MGERGIELARRFREAYDPVISWVEGASDEAWTTYSEAEKATAAVVMDHTAQTFRFFGSVLKAFRENRPPIELAQTQIDATNDGHKAAVTAPAREDILTALRDGLQRLTATLEGFDDEVFQRPQPVVVGEHTVANLDQFVKWVAIPHGRNHLKTLTG